MLEGTLENSGWESSSNFPTCLWLDRNPDVVQTWDKHCCAYCAQPWASPQSLWYTAVPSSCENTISVTDLGDRLQVNVRIGGFKHVKCKFQGLFGNISNRLCTVYLLSKQSILSRQHFTQYVLHCVLFMLALSLVWQCYGTVCIFIDCNGILQKTHTLVWVLVGYNISNRINSNLFTLMLLTRNLRLNVNIKESLGIIQNLATWRRLQRYPAFALKADVPYLYNTIMDMPRRGIFLINTNHIKDAYFIRYGDLRYY